MTGKRSIGLRLRWSYYSIIESIKHFFKFSLTFIGIGYEAGDILEIKIPYLYWHSYVERFVKAGELYTCIIVSIPERASEFTPIEWIFSEKVPAYIDAASLRIDTTQGEWVRAYFASGDLFGTVQWVSIQWIERRL